MKKKLTYLLLVSVGIIEAEIATHKYISPYQIKPGYENLMQAIKTGKESEVKKLVKSSPYLLDGAINNAGMTPLIYAIQDGKWDIVKYLIKEGAQVQGTGEHESPVLQTLGWIFAGAISNNNKKDVQTIKTIIEGLFKNQGVRFAIKNGTSRALQPMFSSGNLDIIKWVLGLIKQYQPTDFKNIKENSEPTSSPVALAIVRANSKLLNYLLENDFAIPNKLQVFKDGNIVSMSLNNSINYLIQSSQKIVSNIEQSIENYEAIKTMLKDHKD